MRYRQKLSASNPAHVQFFVDHFNAVQLLKPVLFRNLHSLLSVSEFCFWCCASFRFLMAVICSPSCIVTELALHRVSVECLLTKTELATFSSFLDLDLVLLSSDSNCRMRAAHFHQMHLRIIWDNAFTFSFSTGVVKLDNESKAKSNYFHRWKYFWECYQKVFHWKMRVSELFDDGMCQVAKSSGQCISSVALHSVVFNS